MPFWPFKRRKPALLTATELRDRLIETAASGSRKQLVAMCKQYKTQIVANVELMCKAPEGMRMDSDAIDRYVQRLGAIAQCLAEECGAPELWKQLCGTPDSNPLMRWESWFRELPQRAERLEHAKLIAEARQFITEAQPLQGTAARRNEAFLNGRMGELLFHSGHVAESVEPFQAALKLCREIDDVEGQKIYLANLLEAHRYLGNVEEAIRVGEEGIKLSHQHALDCESLEQQLQRIRRGEPLCRVVLVQDSKEFELDEFAPGPAGRYEFQFRRNRLSLQMATTLIRQGNELASSGRLADALEKYQEAIDVDPHDPDPVYQSGMCLMELGAYDKARECYDEVERLAPGWFRCRSDRWLAEALATGIVTDDEFRLLRVLEDQGLPAERAKPIALKAIADYPEFAAFHLALGDIHRNQGDNEQALACFRKGIELVNEPDLESRLLCAAAGVLPVGSPERSEFVKRAVNLEGSLVAKAIAVFIPQN